MSGVTTSDVVGLVVCSYVNETTTAVEVVVGNRQKIVENKQVDKRQLRQIANVNSSNNTLNSTINSVIISDNSNKHHNHFNTLETVGLNVSFTISIHNTLAPNYTGLLSIYCAFCVVYWCGIVEQLEW
jgi:hypothetical protein